MTDTAANGWDRAKTLFALGSLVVAIWALQQSCAASKESRETAKKQNELSAQSLQVQQKSFDRGGPNLAINDIQISLYSPSTQDVVVYPPNFPAQNFESVPTEVWYSHPNRFAVFTLANPGDSTERVKSIGLGVNKDSISWAPSSYWGCKDKTTDGYSYSCPTELPPRTETYYSFPLNDWMLTWADEDWESKGLEICAQLEAVNGDYCARSTGTTLPPGAVQNMPPK
jgi:hypothetical protein